MRKLFLLTLAVIYCITLNAQEVGDIVEYRTGDGSVIRGRWLGDARNLNVSFRPNVNPEDLGHIKGVIKDANGNPIKDAQIVISGQFFNRSAKSKKDGSYAIGAMEGMYTFEVVSPGYKKFSVFLALKPQQTQNFDVPLEPDVEGVEQMKGKGHLVVCSDAGYTMKVASSHPAYEGKSLWYLLSNSPMINITSKSIEVGESSFQVFFNGRESKAPFASLKAYCESIKVQDVVEIKVRRTNMANANMPNILYITYKE